MGCSGSSSSDIKPNLSTSRNDKISCNINNTNKGPIDSNNANNEKNMNNTNNNNDNCNNKFQSTNESIVINNDDLLIL